MGFAEPERKNHEVLELRSDLLTTKSQMKEKDREYYLSVGMLILGALGTLARIISKDYTTFAVFGVVVGFGYQAFHLWRKWVRGRPFVCRTDDYPWQQNPVVGTHKDVWMCVPRVDHKKGPEPKVKVIGYKVRMLVEPNEHGDVFVYFPENSFPINWHEVRLQLSITG